MPYFVVNRQVCLLQESFAATNRTMIDDDSSDHQIMVLSNHRYTIHHLSSMVHPFIIDHSVTHRPLTHSSSITGGEDPPIHITFNSESHFLVLATSLCFQSLLYATILNCDLSTIHCHLDVERSRFSYFHLYTKLFWVVVAIARPRDTWKVEWAFDTKQKILRFHISFIIFSHSEEEEEEQ